MNKCAAIFLNSFLWILRLAQSSDIINKIKNLETFLTIALGYFYVNKSCLVEIFNKDDQTILQKLCINLPSSWKFITFHLHFSVYHHSCSSFCLTSHLYCSHYPQCFHPFISFSASSTEKWLFMPLSPCFYWCAFLFLIDLWRCFKY